MWTLLNNTQLSSFHARSPAKLLGVCHPKCAAKHWQKFGAVEVSPEEVGTEVAGGEVGPIWTAQSAKCYTAVESYWSDSSRIGQTAPLSLRPLNPRPRI